MAVSQYTYVCNNERASTSSIPGSWKHREEMKETFNNVKREDFRGITQSNPYIEKHSACERVELVLCAKTHMLFCYHMRLDNCFEDIGIFFSLSI
jgi:hypothetical protein